MTKREVLLVAGALVVAAGALVAVLLMSGDEDVAGDAKPAPTTTTTSMSNEDAVCLLAGGEFRVRVFFDTDQADENMRLAAEVLRADPRVQQIATETQAEAFERFKELYADDPELLEQVTPDVMSAAVEILPVDSLSTDELAKDLEGELTGAANIEKQACQF
ncbi:permease-like cell division protein FtsX [Actinophytocola sediminis]